MKLCAIGFHAWEKWGRPETETWTARVIFSGPTEITRIVQHRTCRDCGAVDRRQIETS